MKKPLQSSTIICLLSAFGLLFTAALPCGTAFAQTDVACSQSDVACSHTDVSCSQSDVSCSQSDVSLGQTYGDQVNVPARWAVVELSANFMREKPDFDQELGDQALMGTVVEILDIQGSWVKIRTPEPYTAWVTDLGLVPLDDAGLRDYMEAPKYICTAAHSCIYEEPSVKSGIVSELVLGDIVRIMYKTIHHTSGRYKGYDEGRAVLTRKFVGVVLPSGKTGYVPAGDVAVFYKWAKEAEALAQKPSVFRDRLVGTARLFLGVPYMWGGTSIKNVDCSGLTRCVYFSNGILLPRNASQQARVGEDVPLATTAWDVSKGVPGEMVRGVAGEGVQGAAGDEVQGAAGDGVQGAAGDGAVNWSALLPGDLIFWGREATDSQPEKATHVGIYIGDGQFIHASHYVRIGSLDPASEYYYDRKPLRARRIVGKSGLCGTGTSYIFRSPSYFVKN